MTLLAPPRQDNARQCWADVRNEVGGRAMASQPWATVHNRTKNPPVRPFCRIRSNGARDRARAGVGPAGRADPRDPADAARWAGGHARAPDRRSRRAGDRSQLRHGAARGRRRVDRGRIRGARCARWQHAAVRHRRAHHAARPLQELDQVRRGEGFRFRLPDQRVELRDRGGTRAPGEVLRPSAGAVEEGAGPLHVQQHGRRLDPAPDRRSVPRAFRREVDARALSRAEPGRSTT